jgi:hypothetical protein
MARRNALPQPAEPKPPSRQRHQRKPDSESATSVKYKKTEKDVAKLIDCLAEWTQELQAARSAAPQVLPRSTRSRSEARSVVSTVPPAPSYPRGNPLTESMEFTDRDRAVWLVYIEGAPRPPGWYLESGTALPERHLRFDSASESRFTSHLPAGSPFLAEARLQSLLDEAQPDLPSALTIGSPARALSSPGYPRSVESGREGIADRSRRWHETASRSEALRPHVLELLSGAANTMHGMVEVLLGHRRARP